MRKFILITAMVLASATAHAGERNLTLAAGDEPVAAAPAKPADSTVAEAPKFVERPSVVDSNAAQPASQCQPAPTTTSAETPKPAPKQVASNEKPRHRHQSTESRIISELHRHGIYW